MDQYRGGSLGALGSPALRHENGRGRRGGPGTGCPAPDNRCCSGCQHGPAINYNKNPTHTAPPPPKLPGPQPAGFVLPPAARPRAPWRLCPRGSALASSFVPLPRAGSFPAFYFFIFFASAAAPRGLGSGSEASLRSPQHPAGRALRRKSWRCPTSGRCPGPSRGFSPPPGRSEGRAARSTPRPSHRPPAQCPSAAGNGRFVPAPIQTAQ